jgi:5-methylcytosine-specific restriction enzyme B
MNTTDRSLALVDMAQRRRFQFEEVNPDPTLSPKDHGSIDLQELLRKWNHRITGLHSRDHRLGHSDFMSQTLADGLTRALAWTIRRKTVPLLMEHVHEDWRKVDAVLGKGGLLRTESFADIQELVEDVVDLSETTSFVVEDWWDPANEHWNAERFRGALSKGSKLVSGADRAWNPPSRR